MLNNKGPEPIFANPTFYSMAGTRLQLAPIVVPAASYLEVDLQELLADAGDEFHEGSLKVGYDGGDYQLGAQVKMTDPLRQLIWAEQLVYTTKFVSSRLENVWWLPGGNAATRFVVSNTSSATVTVTIKVDGTSPQQPSPYQITLAPWETRNLNILADLVGNANGTLQSKGGISIEHTGSPGDVLARMYIAKPNLGYSATASFLDPENTATQRWHGNGFRFRNVNGAALESGIALRNVGTQLSSVTGKIIYTKPNGDLATITLPERQIPAGATRVFDLGPAIDNANVPASVKTGGIEIEYDTPKGTIISSVQSGSPNGEHVFQVPMFDPQKMPSSAGGFPWKADGDFTTLVYIKNETDIERKYTVHLNFEGGNYTLGIEKLKANQAAEIDFRKLRDEQVPDEMGNIIPPNVDKGQIAWSVKGGVNKVLSGRSEQISVSSGVASTYSCANCCPDSVFQTGILPTGTQHTAVGGIQQFTARERDVNCLNTFQPWYVPDEVTWESTETPVALVDAEGFAEAVGTGVSFIRANWESVTWTNYGTYCEPAYNPEEEAAIMEVVGVQKIQYKGPNNSTYADAAGTLYVLKDAQVSFKALPNPSNATFPSGQPVWSGTSGATGTGQTISVTFSTVSSSTSNFKTVIATAGESSVTVNVIVYELVGNLTPQDMFDANRSKIKFGLQELVDLNFTATPSVSAASAGDLLWDIHSGTGELTNRQYDGTARFIAPDAADSTVLKLVVQNGPSKGQFVTTSITTVAPSNGSFIKFGNAEHTYGTFGGAIRGYIHLDPKDVSFSKIFFREGTSLPFTATGYFESFSTIAHPATPENVGIGFCSLAVGCRITGYDDVSTGQPVPVLPYRNGTFTWRIPWKYYTNVDDQTFTTADQTFTSNTSGTVSISKKNSAAFSIAVNDPTSNF